MLVSRFLRWGRPYEVGVGYSNVALSIVLRFVVLVAAFSDMLVACGIVVVGPSLVYSNDGRLIVEFRRNHKMVVCYLVLRWDRCL